MVAVSLEKECQVGEAEGDEMTISSVILVADPQIL